MKFVRIRILVSMLLIVIMSVSSFCYASEKRNVVTENQEAQQEADFKRDNSTNTSNEIKSESMSGENSFHGNVTVNGEIYHVDKGIDNGVVAITIKDENGNVLESDLVPLVNTINSVSTDSEATRSSIRWGSWYYDTITKKYKGTVAALLLIITSKCPLMPVAIASAIATMIITDTDYNYIVVKMGNRTGTDDKYVHVQQRYTIWIKKTKRTNKKKHIYGPTTFSQKRKK